MIAFSVRGTPVGKGRARATRAGAHVRMYTPAKTVAYEQMVAMHARLAMAGRPPIATAVAVEIEVVHEPPASWSRKRRQRAIEGADGAPVCKPDIDNVVKAIGDGSNGIVWMDDSQIAALQVVRRWDERAAVHVRVAEIGAVMSEERNP